MPPRFRLHLVLSALASLAVGCRSTQSDAPTLSPDTIEREAARPTLAHSTRPLGDRSARDRDASGLTSDASRGARIDGSLGRYLAHALRHSPELRAEHHAWRADVERSHAAGTLPDPMVTYAYFIQSVETRVGPQRHRIGVSQAFPWPTKLTASSRAAELASHGSRRDIDASVLALVADVSAAYFRLWAVREERKIVHEQGELVGSLAGLVRSRVAVGQATLADLTQVDVMHAKLVDHEAALEEAEHRSEADLAERVGRPELRPLPTTSNAPPILETAERRADLAAAIETHPKLKAIAERARARTELARARSADGLPSFRLGFDFIETGDALATNVPDSGKDPMIVSLGVSIPLWRGTVHARENEALEERESLKSKERAAKQVLVRELDKTLSASRDAARRLRLYDKTLIPQAESAYGSMLGAYETGRAPLASVLIAERDLLELAVMRVHAARDGAVAWARLEEIVGRRVRTRGAEK